LPVNLIIIDNSESHQDFIDSVISAGLADAAIQIMIGADSARLADMPKNEFMRDGAVTAAFAAIDSARAAGGDIIFMKGFQTQTNVFARILLNHAGPDGARDIGGTLLSHCIIVQEQGQKPFIITDPGMVTYPDKDQKLILARNAMQLYADLFGPRRPVISVISAAGGYNKNIKSSVDARFLIDNLQDVADIRLDQIDTALFPDAARKKGLAPRQPDIVIVPDFESGNIAYKLLAHAGRLIAGLIIGAQYPIILNSRADSDESKMSAIKYAKALAPAYSQRRAKK